MGTPDFAVGILDALQRSIHEITAVITVADKAAGRGQKIKESAVKIYAQANNLTILQPEKLKDEHFLAQLKELQADLFVVVAFRMLPKEVWKMPAFGTINLHASLLPNYRGAAPINWALINGDEETGVTTFFIDEAIDSGKIIAQEKVKISSNINAGDLHDELKSVGAELTLKTVAAISQQTHTVIDQDKFDGKDFKTAPKIFKEDCEISWDETVQNVHNKIRGLSPYPAAWTKLKNTKKNEILLVKLFSSKTLENNGISLTGNLQEHSDGILFPCKNGLICISELQVEGKRRMTYKEFLAGNEIKDWELF
ncbi:MAG: methionyl-tRNA formyltransferase [Crocinitomicaceae bacterium]|nr:methionyl-tRNA formyltransferase [Crocinitomicaceae bacterium]